MSNKKIADEIFERYRAAYDGEVQGCCLLIADEIQRAIGGEVVAGELTYGAGNIRTHWWVEKDGFTFDPMAEFLFLPEDGMRRELVHKDRSMFERLLPNYERWRL